MKKKIEFSYVKAGAMEVLRGNWTMFSLSMVFSMFVMLLLLPVKYVYSFIKPGIMLNIPEYFRIFIASSISETMMFTFTAAMYLVIFKKSDKEKRGIGLLLKNANKVFPASIAPILLTKIIFGFVSFLMLPIVSSFLYDFLFISIIDYRVYVWLAAIFSTVMSVVSVYVSFAYILTPCVIADRPEVGGLEAMRISRQLMKRRKFNMFLFILSFAVWYLMGMCCFGIGILWVHSYAMTAVYIYYLRCKDIENAK